MSDLTERLRLLAQAEHDDLSVGDEAADHIEALEAEIQRLRGAIVAFCADHDWASEAWKRQRHIAELFAIASESDEAARIRAGGD